MALVNELLVTRTPVSETLRRAASAADLGPVQQSQLKSVASHHCAIPEEDALMSCNMQS